MERNDLVREEAWRHLLGEMSEREAAAFDQSLLEHPEWKPIYHECGETLAAFTEFELQPRKANAELWNRIESEILDLEQMTTEEPSSRVKEPWFVRSWKFWAAAACLSLGINLYQSIRTPESPTPSPLPGDPAEENTVRSIADTAADKSSTSSGIAETGSAIPSPIESEQNIRHHRETLVSDVATLESRKRELEYQIDYVERQLLRYADNVERVIGRNVLNPDASNAATVVVMNGPEGNNREYPSGIWSYLKSLRDEPGVSLAFSSDRARQFLNILDTPTDLPLDGKYIGFAPELADRIEPPADAEITAGMTLDDVVSTYAFALFNEESKQAFISARNVAQPQVGEQYHLWARDSATQSFVSVGTVPEFMDTENLELAAVLPEQVEQVDAWMLTAEPVNTSVAIPSKKVVFSSENIPLEP